MKKYDVHEKLGEGGFGEVFRATRLSDNLVVAIKFLHAGAGADERHRFEREVKLIGGHQHPKIIKLLDYDLTAERPYYVMPYMRGGPLTRWVGKLPIENVRAVLRGLLDVLVYMHRTGGIHRDLKPDNVLVDGEGQIALGDFGHGNSPKYTVKFTLTAAGTPGYAAPELFRPGGLASPSSDIYSLGATIFHLLTGIHPVGAGTLDLQHHAPDVPVDLKDLVKRMVARDPTQRPTAEQLAEMLGVRQSAPSQPPATASQPGFTPRRAPTKIGGGRYA
jgi:eukaryotic-like serine/threonine-protein kinase